MNPGEKGERTEGETRVLTALDNGASTPSEIASSLGISVSAVSQQLRRLLDQGVVTRTRMGRTAKYRITPEDAGQDLVAPRDVGMEEWRALQESLEALNKVWSHVLRLRLSPEELRKLREARNLLEEILHDRGFDKP